MKPVNQNETQNFRTTLEPLTVGNKEELKL